MVVNEGMMEEVEQFSYLGDVLDCEAGVERAVRAKVIATWRRRQEITSLLVNSIGLRTREYENCVRPALLYGADQWVLYTDVITE